MVRIDEQQWCKDLRNKKNEPVKLGSHRIKASWIQNRYEWLDKNGRPEPPEWQKSGFSALKDQVDQSYVVNAGDENKQASFDEPWEEQVISTDLTQEGDEETFAFMSMTKEEDQQDCTPQLTPFRKLRLRERHEITWDTLLTVAQGSSEKRTKLRKQNLENAKAAAEKEVEAKEEI